MDRLDTATAGSISSSGTRRRTIKPHRKSRRGCFTCKGRKVKCCETRPQCSNCLKSGLNCVYPEAPPMAVSTRIGKIQYQSRGYSLRDMRFFHDFITVSFPHLPLNAENAWKHDIPIVAQQHEFLMHAILALGASHLHARTNLDLKQTVERHRNMAMRGLTDTCADISANVDRLNAQLATAYALTFCASYMGDSMSLFLVLVRSCASLSMQIMGSGMCSPLFPGGGNTTGSQDHTEIMRDRLAHAPLLSCKAEIERAKASLETVAELCTFTPVELDIWTNMRQILDKIDTPFESYCHLIAIWDIFTSMSAADFTRFANTTTNVTSNALQTHFLAFEELLKPWLVLQLPEGRLDNHQARYALEALPAIATLDSGAESMFEWPTKYIKAAHS